MRKGCMSVRLQQNPRADERVTVVVGVDQFGTSHVLPRDNVLGTINGPDGEQVPSNHLEEDLLIGFLYIL